MLTACAAIQVLVKKSFLDRVVGVEDIISHILAPAPQVFPWAVNDCGEEEGWVSWMASWSEAHIYSNSRYGINHVFPILEQPCPM